jgi:phage shock protein A
MVADTKSKASSLRWAIEELSKQQSDLDAKLKVAKKRDETSSLIDEVFAQKDALEKRISALQDGLRVSTDLVDTSSSDLQSELEQINEKLSIAQERLESIEQEEYLEELGKKLNRSHDASESFKDDDALEPLDEFDEVADIPAEELQSLNKDGIESSTDASSSTAQSAQPLPIMTAAKTNRIPEIKEEDKPVETSQTQNSKLLSPSSLPISLGQTAASLGIEPEFLAEKGLQAILRMIARNHGKISFPLEVDQID